MKVTKTAEKAMAEALIYKDHNNRLYDITSRKMIRGNQAKSNLVVIDTKTYSK